MQTTKQQPRKKKADPLKARGIKYIDYRDVKLLSRFVNEQGKILPSRITGISSKMQRKLTTAIKRARHLALMPFVSEDFRQ
ncbi:MAG: 30S ribosomal protein S18 [Ignavibacteria bacterium]